MRFSKYLPYIAIFTLSFIFSSFFTFFVYSNYSEALNAPLDIDKHGALALGVYKAATFSYYPNLEASVNRGPLYPLFGAIMLFITKGWYPAGIQLGHSFLHGFTSLLIFHFSQKFFSVKRSFLIGGITAIHPYIILFMSRIYIETLSICMFTAVTITVILFCKSPTLLKAIFIGILIGLASLTKVTFLFFIIIAPIYFFIVRKKCLISYMQIFSVVIAGLLVISPWTIRNWYLTREFIPVHLLIGYNFQVGDKFTEYFYSGTLFESEESDDLYPTRSFTGVTLAVSEFVQDRRELQKSLLHYEQDPLFLVKKIIYNAGAFWFYGSTKLKTFLVFAVQLPLIIAFLFAIKRVLQRPDKEVFLLPILLVIFYYLEHLIGLALARFSVPLIPTMLFYAIVFNKPENPASLKST